MEKTLKQIMNSVPSGTNPYIIHTNLTYPVIEGNTSNFVTDYQANAAAYNGYALLKRGKQVIDVDEEDLETLWNYFSDISGYVTDVHLVSWARLYYALSLSYNPLYNVDGTTRRTVSQRERTDAYGAQSGSATIGAISASDVHGARSATDAYGATQTTDAYGATQLTDAYGATQKTDEYGATSETLGSHTDTGTTYSVSFDNSTEKETGKTVNEMGSQTNTANLHTDTHSDIAHSDTHSGLAHSDTHSDIAHSDTHSELGYTDSHTEQARSDSHSENAYTDRHTDAQYTETEERFGNIGVTKSTELMESEWEFRKKSFFETIINQLLDDIGFYYNGGIRI